MKQKKVLLYCFGIDNVLSGSSKVAGIQVQMSFWAQTFVKYGWKVVSFTDGKSRFLDGIQFLCKKITWLDRHGLSIVKEIFDVLKYVQEVDLVFLRGAGRRHYFVEKVCRVRKIKLVFLGACDRDFDLGRELMKGSPLNVRLYRRSIYHIQYFVTQNQYQSDSLLNNYGKKSLILSNIWPKISFDYQYSKQYDAVWIANLRRLKRAEWFLNLAKQMPEKNFAIAGGVNELMYYEKIKTEAELMPNVQFLGALSFQDVNRLIGMSKLLVCTSEFEGFPNTFLQAWSHNIPIVSTVNPNNCLTKYDLGRYVTNELDLHRQVSSLLDDLRDYQKCQVAISSYFEEHHDADMGYEKVMAFINKNVMC